jgi:hypothetical protein
MRFGSGLRGRVAASQHRLERRADASEETK